MWLVSHMMPCCWDFNPGVRVSGLKKTLHWSLDKKVNLVKNMFYIFRLPNLKLSWPTPANQMDLQSSTKTVVCLKTCYRPALINIRHSTWHGSPFTWQQQQPAEAAPVQEEAAVAQTRWWYGTPLIWKPAHRSVPRARILTATERFPSMEGSAGPLRMAR